MVLFQKIEWTEYHQELQKTTTPSLNTTLDYLSNA